MQPKVPSAEDVTQRGICWCALTVRPHAAQRAQSSQVPNVKFTCNLTKKVTILTSFLGIIILLDFINVFLVL